ncbi:hypothetical protein NDN08_002868 [Rhodosorus marinus]|uniref:Protein ZIP4 homolog n=1 Tax=Rhodosorus marinus TaxID=101924 RepID=A0AAV8UUY7_9RHOD|nr:hypothetical protein NDN08_002868 [Rhodosorus marinus]
MESSTEIGLLGDLITRFREGAEKDAGDILGAEIPEKLGRILHRITEILSRNDAERLLEHGVTLWNSVVTVDVPEKSAQEKENNVNLVKLRHIAADAIYMGISALGGISTKFEITDASLLQFYSACGRRYMDIENLDLADVCYQKAFEFLNSMDTAGKPRESSQKQLAKVVFELFMGAAECAWEKKDTESAFVLVESAAKKIDDIPEEIDFLARLLEQAEEHHKDTATQYFLFKASLSAESGNSKLVLNRLLGDEKLDVDIALTALNLAMEKKLSEEALEGYELLLRNSALKRTEIVSATQQFAEASAAIGRIEKAFQIASSALKDSVSLLDAEHTQKEISQWTGVLLSIGSSLADKQYYSSASKFLNLAVDLIDNHCAASTQYNQVSVLKLCISCEILAGAEQHSGSDHKAVDHPLSTAMKHAAALFEKDGDSFETNLLLFRIHVLRKEEELAIESIVQATKCDGALADSLVAAAMEAKERGLEAVTRSIFKEILSSDSVDTKGLPQGFYGYSTIHDRYLLLRHQLTRQLSIRTVLQAAALAYYELTGIDPQGEIKSVTHDQTEIKNADPSNGLENLAEVLQLGLDGIDRFGAKAAFVEEELEEGASNLCDIAWNAGRFAGESSYHKLWARFFAMSFKYGSIRKGQKIARIMTITALLEDPSYEQEVERLKEALNLIHDTRDLIDRCQQMFNPAQIQSEDAAVPLLVLLETRTRARLGDFEGLESAVLGLLGKGGQQLAPLLEKVAAICFQARGQVSRGDHVEGSAFRENCLDLAQRVLEFSYQTRLESGLYLDDLNGVAVLLRELANLSFAKKAESCFEFLKEISTLVEKHSTYPGDESRWAASRSWELAQLFLKCDKMDEFNNFGEIAIKICQESSSACKLHAFVKPLQDFITSQNKLRRENDAFHDSR